MATILKIGVDVDGCLANFNQAFAQKFRLHGFVIPQELADNPPTWDWPQNTCGFSDNLVTGIWNEIDRDTEFWMNLEPLPGAIAALDTLDNLAEEGHEIVFMTLRRGDRAKRQTEIWLEQHGMTFPTVLTTPQGKARPAYELGLTHVVDDYPRILQDYCLHAQALKPYPAIYMVEHLYNQECKAWPLTPVKSVGEMLDMILDHKEQAA